MFTVLMSKKNPSWEPAAPRVESALADGREGGLCLCPGDAGLLTPGAELRVAGKACRGSSGPHTALHSERWAHVASGPRSVPSNL